jgi:mono/diheme cytochrome c family protein
MSMRAIALLLLSLGSIFSCNNPESASRPAAGDALPSTILEIDPGHDTTVTTPGGAILKIPQGSLDAGGATSVKLEVKEAFLPEDIVRGKLFTHTEDRLLSSGGIIYINAAPGQSVTIKQPISVMIPTTNVVTGMMAYDGQVDTGGNMNWTNPRPLSDVSAGGSSEAGKTIFETNCASCHGMRDEMAGPPLAWINSRRNKAWLADFTRNNARMLWRGDAYSCFLFNRYKKSAMPIYHFSDTELGALYAYISSASRGIDSNSVPDLKRTFDSCSQSDPYCDGAPAKTSPEYTQADVAAVSANSGAAAMGEASAGGAGSTSGGSNYYGFTLARFGWNSINVPVRELPGIEVSDLLVRVKGDHQEKTEVFLGIPSAKVLARGVFAADKNEYYFDTPDGKITLPQGVTAYIVVRTEGEGQTFFGKAKWIIGKHQLVTAEQSAMSAEEIAHAIHELPLDSTALQNATAAWDSAGNTGTGTAGSGGTDSTVTAGTETTVPSGVPSGGPAGNGGDGGAANSGGTAASVKRGRRRNPESLQACPCWCDEMDYRKADSIARAAGAGQ